MAVRGGKRIDYAILIPFLVLVFGVGLAALASASSGIGLRDANNPYFYLKEQIIFGIGLGSLGFIGAYLLNYRFYRKIAPLLLIVGVGLALLLFTNLGLSAGGAQRWLALGPFTIQPSEILKLVMIIYLAAWLSGQRASEREKSFGEGLIPFVSVVGFVCLILFFQNSTSAAIIIGGVSLLIYFAAGARWPFVISLILAGLAVLSLFIVATPYRRERIEAFLNPGEDVQDSSFQINQALTVIGSGGWFGVGYGQSYAKNSLPESASDSIFAIIAEEFGLIGAVIVMVLFFTLVFRGITAAKKTGDKFGRLILVGASSLIGLQAFVHIASALAFIPTTGVPLPFVSYGRFSLIVFMTMVGIMLNVRKNS